MMQPFPRLTTSFWRSFQPSDSTNSLGRVTYVVPRPVLVSFLMFLTVICLNRLSRNGNVTCYVTLWYSISRQSAKSAKPWKLRRNSLNFQCKHNLIFRGNSTVEWLPVNAVDPENNRRVTIGSFQEKFWNELSGITVKPFWAIPWEPWAQSKGPRRD